jgi:carbon-monoxide dehydrogenase medium subunit
MYPSAFDYRRATTVEEAVALLEEEADAELLAGGQSLIPLQKNRLAAPGTLIDLNPIADLEYVEEEDEVVRLGALARHDAVQHDGAVQQYAYLFSEAISQIADQQIRNQGTVGGTVAEADPSGDYFPPLKLLNPDVVVTGPEGERTVPFEEFYLGMFTVDLEETELVTEVRLPKLRAGDDAAALGSSYRKHARVSGAYATASAAAILRVDDDGTVVDADLAIGAVGPLFRADEAEDVVVGTSLDDDTLEAAATAVSDAAMPDETGREGRYRERMAGVFAKRALETAYERAEVAR